jgi:hypothetical protein
MSRRAKLYAKVMSRVLVDEDGCYIWQGPDSGKKGRGKGYPRMNVDGATMAVHIVMWVIENGPIPPKKQLDHTCRKRLCVRPTCTELVTHLQNQRRRAQAQRAVKNAVVLATGDSPQTH